MINAVFNLLVGLHRCWWRMLETKCICDNLKMLMAVLSHLHRDSLTYIWKLSPPISHHYHDVTNITVIVSSDIKPRLSRVIESKCFLCEKNSIHKSKNIKTSEQILSGRCLSYSKILFTWLGNQNLNLINSVLGNFRCTIN